MYKAKDVEVAWMDAKIEVKGGKTDTGAMFEREEGEIDEEYENLMKLKGRWHDRNLFFHLFNEAVEHLAHSWVV